MTDPLSHDPDCWLCLSTIGDLATAHAWTGGQHAYGSGRLVLPYSSDPLSDSGEWRSCDRCGTVFAIRPLQKSARYCSQTCLNYARRDRERARRKAPA